MDLLLCYFVLGAVAGSQLCCAVDKKIKKLKTFILIQGVARAGLEGFPRDPRESSSGRSCRSRVASARRERDATRRARSHCLRKLST